MSDPILRRREAALRLMASTGIWRSNYAPPLVRLAWRLGWDLPLPHFLPAWQVVLGFGVYFGVAFTGLMWLMLGRSEGWAADRLASMALVAGALFGVSMALYYAHGRRKNALPRWEDLSQ